MTLAEKVFKTLLALLFLSIYGIFVILMFFYGPLAGIIALAVPGLVVWVGISKGLAQRKAVRRARANS